MGTGDAEEVCRSLIAAAGGRLTKPRISTLHALMEAGGAVSHADVHRRLPELDRVSLYRALDWLADHHLAHRLTDTDGVRRYGASLVGDHRHPHFQCTSCGLTTCLEEAKAPAIRLPKGYRQAATDVLVKGLCRTCTTIR